MASPPRRALRLLSLDEAIFSLQDERIPQPSLDDLVHILLKCRKERDRAQALRLHAYMRSSGLEDHRALGNYLVPMLVDVGNMHDAQQVFDMLAYPNEWSWESLIGGYIKCGNVHDALILYQKTEKDESLCLSGRILVLLLKTCTNLKDFRKGLKVHAEISRNGLLERDDFVGSMLVDMYAKCGSFARAAQVFNELPVQDVVTWTTLIAGYGEHGYGEHAIKCYDQMRLKGVPPNSVTFVCILKACGSIGAINKIKEIHVEIEKQGLMAGELVGNTLIDTYARCGVIALARQVFDKLPVRDAVSWNSLIKGYTAHEHCEEALKCFEQMQLEGLSPSAVTFVCSLKACGAIGAIDKGEYIHIEIERQGLLDTNHFVAGALVDMYIKCGLLAKAQQLFDKLPDRDVVSWTALIAGYIEHGYDEEALRCFEQMQVDGVLPNSVTLVFSLKACANIQAIDRGQEVHAEIERQCIMRKESVVGNSLVDMYAKCGFLALAQELFDMLQARDIVSWNALIGGYTEHGFVEEALVCFEQMQVEGVPPDCLTFVCCLKACGSIQDSDKGNKIYREIERQGLLERDVIGNALVDMYAKCGMLVNAQQVFDKLLVRDVISWTALITGYTELGDGEKALKCFANMQQEGVIPNAVTLICILKACGSMGATDKGADVHIEIEKKGLLETDLVVGNTLVDMYAKCGSLSLAQEVFDKLPIRDIISWNALITGYAEHGHVEEALLCLEQMQFQGFLPNSTTFVCVLKACGSIGATERGGRIHAEIERRGLLDGELVGNTLVNMYAKCGSLAKALQVFDKLPLRDVVSWTTLMTGYAEVGETENVFNIFDRMLGEGIKPNPVTFVVVLSACTNKGLFTKCQTYFEAMSTEYGVFPNLEHHSCVVNLLGRRGELDTAVSMIKKMHLYPNPVLWHTVLAACRNWGNVQFGKQAFEHAMNMDDSDPLAYIRLSQIYADAELLEEGNKAEAVNL